MGENHQSISAFCRQLPKAELHLHLEGSVEPETLREMAPGLSLEEIRSHYRYEGFEGFLNGFGWVVRRLRGPGDYALAARRLLERLEGENVRYAEIILSAGVVLWKQQEFASIYDAVREAAAGSRVEVWWILDAIRHFGVEHTRKVAELAAERVDDGVVAFGIGGDEARGPAEWFKEVYAFARGEGLRLTAHAGEAAGPESIRAALEIGAERIGHGIRAAGDPDLMQLLKEREIPLEISISSNVATGVCGRLEEHPVRRLFDAGVPLVLNTDDPAMFHTTLSREYEIAATCFGFTQDELRQLARNSFRHAFRPVSFPEAQ